MRSPFWTLFLMAAGCASPASDYPRERKSPPPERAPAACTTAADATAAVAFVSTQYHTMTNIWSDRSGVICGCVFVSEGKTVVDLSAHFYLLAPEVTSERRAEPFQVEPVRIATRSGSEIVPVRRLRISAVGSFVSGFLSRYRYEFEGVVPGEELVGLRVAWKGGSILLPIDLARSRG